MVELFSPLSYPSNIGCYGNSLIFIEEEAVVVVLLFILHVDVHAPVVVVRGAVVGGDRAADRQDDPWRR